MFLSYWKVSSKPMPCQTEMHVASVHTHTHTEREVKFTSLVYVHNNVEATLTELFLFLTIPLQRINSESSISQHLYTNKRNMCSEPRCRGASISWPGTSYSLHMTETRQS